MDTTEVIVLVAGLAAVVAICWYFFGESAAVSATVVGDGQQEIDITVKGGYSPDVIVVKKGAPVRLNFYRDETSSCSEKVIFGDLGIARELPAFKTTVVEFTPKEAGEFPFTCGMSMLHGKLIVK